MANTSDPPRASVTLADGSTRRASPENLRNLSSRTSHVVEGQRFLGPLMLKRLVSFARYSPRLF